jgi:hypothetical protein
VCDRHDVRDDLSGDPCLTTIIAKTCFQLFRLLIKIFQLYASSH